MRTFSEPRRVAQAERGLAPALPGAAIVGRPLPAAVRTPYETALGYDFANVRVHDRPADAPLARGIDARGFTCGDDIVLDRPLERLPPGTLAHELVHVAQQRGARDDGAPRVASHASSLEANADSVVDRMWRADPAAGAHVARASTRAIHRQSPSSLPPVPNVQLSMRHGDPLAPQSGLPRLRPHLQPEDFARIEAFLALHGFHVGARLRPTLDGAATTLDAVTAALRALVLPIIERGDIEDYVAAHWRAMVIEQLTRVPLTPIPPTPIANIFADIPAASTASPEHVRPTLSVGVNYAWHVALAPGGAATHDRALQLQIGEDAPLQRIFQVSYNVDTQQTQVVVGGQATSADIKLVGELLKINGFVQVLAGVSWTGSPASGAFTMLQPSAGAQLTLDFGPVQLAVQAAGSITAVQGSPTTADANVTGQFTIPLESKPGHERRRPASGELSGHLEIRDWIDGASFGVLQRLVPGEKARLMRSLVGGGAIIDVDIDAIAKLWEATADYERTAIRPIVERALTDLDDPARAARLRTVLSRPAFPR